MRKPLSLDSFVSAQIARSNPLENTPELEAALHRQAFVPNTWGGYATALMDHLDIEPREALAMLRITSDDIADSTLQFSSGNFYNNPEDYYTKKFQQEAKAELQEEKEHLRGVVDTISEGWKVNDTLAAQEKADKLQEQIMKTRHTDPASLLCARRDALNDGMVVTADEFVRTMLAADVINEDQPTELAKEWIRGIYAAVEYVVYEYHIDRDTKLSDITLGLDAINTMKYSIDCYNAARKIAHERWERIAPVFLARSLGEFPLLAGTES